MKKKDISPTIITKIYNALEHPRNKHFKLANNILGLVTIISILAVVLETVVSLQQYLTLFVVIEWAAVVFFSLEYFIRVYATKNKKEYIFSFFGIVDLLAILPSLIGLSNFTFLKAARTVRVIRLLRMIRLTKVARFSDEKEGMKSVLGINFEIYTIAFTLALLMLGASFYLFESRPDAVDIPSGMYWALRVILGGVSYPQPETLGGTITLIFSRFTAMIVLGMVIGLVGTILRLKLTGSEKDVK
jgi:voltage-gated potassium channel